MATEIDLTGKTAVVTGALGKLGPVWVAALGEAGARVVGIDLGNGELPGDAELHVADVTDRDSLAAVLERIETPDVLVNNAGVDAPPDPDAPTRRVHDIPLDDFRHFLEVNLTGTFAATQVFGAPMAEAGRGSIVNIGSLYASIAPDPGLYDHIESDPPFIKPPAYGASKAGVVQLTRYFARLWGPSGVRVNALSPGGVLGEQDATFRAKFEARTPLRAMADRDRDLAGPLLFLASDLSRYVTGHELRVDGGFTA